MPRYSFKNKFAVVTGASSGIGKAISLSLAKKGAKLFLTSHPMEIENLALWCKELKTKYTNDVFYSVADLSHKNGPEILYKSVKEKIDSPDILINNAGIMAYGQFQEIPLKDQIKIVDVNAKAYMVLMHLFMQEMIKKGEGRILNVSSVAAFQPTPFHSVYGATKAFVQNLSEAVQYDAKGTGVKICTLNPPYTNTPMLTNGTFPKKLRWFSLSGLWEPEDIAEKGIKALKKGKSVYIPGFGNKFMHTILPRFIPRHLEAWFSSVVLKEQ